MSYHGEVLDIFLKHDKRYKSSAEWREAIMQSLVDWKRQGTACAEHGDTLMYCNNCERRRTASIRDTDAGATLVALLHTVDKGQLERIEASLKILIRYMDFREQQRLR